MSRLRLVTRLSDTDLAEARLGDDLVARVAVVVVGGCAVLGLAAAGLVAPGVAAMDVVLVAACSAVAGWTLRHPGWRVLRLVTWLGVGSWVVVSAAAGPLAGRPEVLLGTLLAGFVAATSAEQDGTRRSTVVNVALGVAVLTLAAGIGPTGRLAGPIGLAWVAGLVALAQLPPRRERARATAVAVVRLSPHSRRSQVRAVRVAAAVPLIASVLLGLVGFGAIRALRVGGSPDSGYTSTTLGPGSPDGGSSRLASAYAGGSLDLSSRAALADSPLLGVPTGSAQLWRTGTLDRYTGAGWDVTRAQPQLLRGGGAIDVPPPVDDPLPSAPAPATVDQVVSLGPPIERVAAPGLVTGLELPPAMTLVQQQDGGLLPISAIPELIHYQVASVPRPLVDGPDGEALHAAAGPDGADPADPRWTALPGTVPSRVRDLGVRLVRAQPDRTSAVRAVAETLRTTATYTLDSPVPGPGQDAVDDFLFVSHQGFCEQFASAEVVLLRAAGIPARLVVGFAGGRPSADPGRRELRGTDAHAWAEVWFPGHGWASVDPTAGTVPAGPGLAAVVRDRLAGWWWVVLLAVAGVAAGVVLMVRRRPSRLGSPGREPHPGEVELVAAFGRLEAALAASGVARRPQESLAELARRQSPVLPAEALNTLERLTFAPTPPDPARCLAAAAELDAAAGRLA